MDFDDKIKEIIDGASEVPDAFVWERISATLNVRARRMRYFKRGVYSVASAAVLAVLLFVDFGDKNVNNNLKVIPVTGITAESSTSKPEKVSVVKKSGTTKVVKHKIGIVSVQEEKVAVYQEPVQTEPNIESASIVSKEEVAINKDSEQNPKTENKKQDVTKKVYRNTIADLYTPTSKRRLSKVNVSAYAHLTSSYQNSSTNMYAPGIDLDDSKTFMAPATQFYIESDTKYYVPTQFGVQLQIPVTSRYSVGTGLTYSFLRCDVKTTATGGESYTVITQLQYLGVPVKLSYNLISSKNLKVYANVGAVVDKCINANIRVVGSGVADSDVNSQVKPLALSVNGGMGIEYMFNRYLGMYADPGLTYYFSNNQPISIRTVEQLQFKCEVGLRLHL